MKIGADGVARRRNRKTQKAGTIKMKAAGAAARSEDGGEEEKKKKKKPGRGRRGGLIGGSGNQYLSAEKTGVAVTCLPYIASHIHMPTSSRPLTPAVLSQRRERELYIHYLSSIVLSAFSHIPPCLPPSSFVPVTEAEADCPSERVAQKKCLLK